MNSIALRRASLCCSVALVAFALSLPAEARKGSSPPTTTTTTTHTLKTNTSKPIIKSDKTKLTHSRNRSHMRWGSSLGTSTKKIDKTNKKNWHSRNRSHLRWGSKVG